MIRLLLTAVVLTPVATAWMQDSDAAVTASAFPARCIPVQLPTGIFLFESCDPRPVALACLGDVDADGMPDFAVGMPSWFREPQSLGRVVVQSSADGTVISDFSLPGESTTSRRADLTGTAVARTPDLDADGACDMAIGSPGDYAYGSTSGVVHLVSSRTAGILRSWEGAAYDDRFGKALAIIEHAGPDGSAALLIGAPQHHRRGYAILVSVTDGSELRRFTGPEGCSNFGCSVADAGDLDGDGVHDVVIAAYPGCHEFGSMSDKSLVLAYSMADGHVLYTVRGGPGACLFGRSFAVMGDVDHDGADDFAVGSPWSSGVTSSSSASTDSQTHSGREATNEERTRGGAEIRILSGRDGSSLGTIAGSPDRDDSLGYSIAAAGDLDRDGTNDLLVRRDGLLEAYSGKDFSRLGSLKIPCGGDAARALDDYPVVVLGDVDDDDLADFGVLVSYGMPDTVGRLGVVSGKDLLAPH